MIEETYSLEVVDAVISASDLPSGGSYTRVGTYPSEEMSMLVATLSREVGAPPEDLLRAFGDRLFGRFVEMYPAFFPADQGIGDFLSGLESYIHSEVRKLYPDAETPTIDVLVDGDDSIELTYQSPRDMPDLAEGLLIGAIGHFGAVLEIQRSDLGGQPPTTRFTLTRPADS